MTLEAADPEEILPVADLANALGVAEADIQSRTRVPLTGWRTPVRIVERVTWTSSNGTTSRTACVKYGPGLEREALIYAMQPPSTRDLMPAMVANCALGSGSHLVATEWVPGRAPRFSDPQEVAMAFAAAGDFAGRWASRVASWAVRAEDLSLKPLPASLARSMRELCAHVLDQAWYRGGLIQDLASVAAQRDLLMAIGCPDLREVGRELVERASHIARAICAVPVTLVNRDVTDDNFLLTPDGACRLLDWEDAAIAPAVQWFENLGGEDPTGSVPTGAAIDVALRAFCAGFRAVGVRMSLGRLNAAWRCLRVVQAVFHMGESAMTLARGDSPEEVRPFLQRQARALPKLAQEAVTVL